MDQRLFFNFNTDLSKVEIPEKLNNPFSIALPEVAHIAAKEFQQFITSKSEKWDYDFNDRKGKMFGTLVVQKTDSTYGYLGAVSGKTPGNAICKQLVPSIFDESADDFFINKGMTELTEIGSKIKEANTQLEIDSLTTIRRQKSLALQQQLFENYRFLNLVGTEQNVLQIFQNSSQGKPPSAAGECAAPKLLQYALKHGLKPIAISEFWWGKPMKNLARAHKSFYPACKSKCRPILEYMLDAKGLFDRADLKG